ncbi:type IX secretion system membrane protein PorP/SprF [Maribacter cobaltidurans]
MAINVSYYIDFDDYPSLYFGKGEVSGILDFGQRFELGASYRYDESISGLFLFNVSNGFNLGYAYETLKSQFHQ